MRSVELLDEPAVRPPDFDLQRAWEEIVATLDDRRGVQYIKAKADPAAMRWLRAQFATRLTVGESRPDGRVDVELTLPATHDDPARELAAYADTLEVVEPAEVRARMAEFGRALVARHEPAF